MDLILTLEDITINFLRSQLKPLIVTNYVLILRYEENQLFTLPLTPISLTFG